MKNKLFTWNGKLLNSYINTFVEVSVSNNMIILGISPTQTIKTCGWTKCNKQFSLIHVTQIKMCSIFTITSDVQ